MALPIGSGGSETNRRGAELLCRLHQQCEMDNIRLQARAAEGKFEVEHNLAVVVRELSDLVPDGRSFFLHPSFLMDSSARRVLAPRSVHR